MSDNNNYAERNGRAILINAPYIFSVCWAVISAMLDSATNAKVQILSSERFWRPLLLEAMDASEIPVEYGGTNNVHMRDIFAPANPPPLPSSPP